MITLRGYQQEAADKLRASFARGHRKVVLQLPTGAGKSRIGAHIMESAAAKGKRSLFIVERLQLADQMAEHLESFGIDYHVETGISHKFNPFAMITVATIQTLARRNPRDYALILQDECHISHTHHRKMMEQYQVPWIGLSATPWAKGMGKLWDDLVVGTKITDLISQGYLVDSVVFAPFTPDLTKIRDVRGDYDAVPLAHVMDQGVLIGDIVAHWHRLAEGRKTLVYCVNISHSKHVAEKFSASGVETRHLDAYTNPVEKQSVISAFKRGEIRVLCSVDLLGRGFDVPDVGCIVMARPTKSLMVYIQQGGRGLRIAEGKEHLIVLDHAGNTARHGFLTDDFPTVLDDGTKSTSPHKDTPKEKLPHKCPFCHRMKPAGMFICPSCGLAPKKEHGVQTVQGELVEIKKSGKIANMDQARVYAELLGYAAQKGHKPGKAYYQFKTIFKKEPTFGDITPMTPSPETLSLIKYLNIKQARSHYHRATP